MSENCQLVVFSNKAYNAIIRESFDKDPVETGGILLGHILDNGVWIVMDVLPPGINSIFQYAYFEYDEAFVNYLAQSVANQYKRPLDLLGLWHRHPGNMDVFSSTDDGTNATFARQNPAGVISGLVNIDPQFRLTMYHMDRPTGRLMGRPNYETIDVEVGDDIIPEEYFELRYYDGENSNLHPMVSERQRNSRPRQVESSERSQMQPPYSALEEEEQGELDINRIISNQLPPRDETRRATPKSIDDFFSFWRASNKKWLYILLAFAVLIIVAFTIKSCKYNIERIYSQVSSWVVNNKDKSEDSQQEEASSLSKESITLTTVGATEKIEVDRTDENIRWESSNPQIATINKGTVTAIANGTTTITAHVGNKEIGKCIITVNIPESKIKNGNLDSDDTNTTDGEVGAKQTDVDKATNATIDVSRTFQHGKSGSMKIGDPAFTIPLKVSGNPQPSVTFGSSNNEVAKVDANGKVTAISKGIVEIAIICNGKQSDTFTIQVKEK